MARNVSVYSVYNAAGTYYFGSDRANPLDTNYPYSNAMMGSMFAYGDDNTKLVNHAHYYADRVVSCRTPGRSAAA